MFDVNSAESIINYAKLLEGKTLREVCEAEIERIGYKKGKGNFGQNLEKFYFGYELNSDAEPDFKEAGLELKSSPIKKLKNGQFRSKERLVLNIINYLEVYKEDFNTSSFIKKNAHLLLVFYLYSKNQEIFDYKIKLVDDWEFPEEDLKVIQHDWEIINEKIASGKAHELSEGDTFYLGACTKGQTSKKSLRNQPFSGIKAKQRAYSLKGGYVNHILANISNNYSDDFGKIIEYPEIIDESTSIEELVLSKFQLYYGKSNEELEQIFGLNLNRKSKSYFASLVKSMLGFQLNQKIKEFEAADIQLKTIRVEENNRIEQSVSFPAFDFQKLYEEHWIDSNLKDLIEKKFLFIFFKKKKGKFYFDKAKFWNMPFEDRNEVRKVWLKTKKVIQSGNIVKGFKTDKKGNVSLLNNFPKKIENRVSHVRPHARDRWDVKPLPIMDNLTKAMNYTKQCFWLNWDYLRDEIYLK